MTKRWGKRKRDDKEEGGRGTTKRCRRRKRDDKEMGKEEEG